MPASQDAAALDAADPLAEFRSLFQPASDVVAYLDGNSLGRPLIVTAERMAAFVRDQWGGRLIRGWSERWLDLPESVGDRLGALVLGAGAGSVFVGDSTSVLLYKLLRAACADRPGRSEIVIDADNFPTDRYLVEGVAAERGLTVRWLPTDPAGGVTPADLATVLTERTAVTVLSHVAYRSGFVADVAGCTAAVHAVGGLTLWDLSHSVGALPVRLDDWQVDLAVGCTYKYLNGGPGAPAFAFVRPDLQPALRQPIWGWLGAADPFEMGPSYVPAEGIRRFGSGTPPILAMQPLIDMLDVIDTATITAIRAKALQLNAFALELVQDRLVGLGAEVASPPDPASRGSHLMVEHRQMRAIIDPLWQAGVIPDFRGPRGLRIGLSPLSTSFAEVQAGIAAIADLLAGLE